jgi:hypothetical protein
MKKILSIIKRTSITRHNIKNQLLNFVLTWILVLLILSGVIYKDIIEVNSLFLFLQESLYMVTYLYPFVLTFGIIGYYHKISNEIADEQLKKEFEEKELEKKDELYKKWGR